MFGFDWVEKLETVHCSTKDVYTSEITFLALHPCTHICKDRFKVCCIILAAIRRTQGGGDKRVFSVVLLRDCKIGPMRKFYTIFLPPPHTRSSFVYAPGNCMKRKTEEGGLD